MEIKFVVQVAQVEKAIQALALDKRTRREENGLLLRHERPYTFQAGGHQRDPSGTDHRR